MLSAHGTVAIVAARFGAMHFDVFPSHFEAVLATLDSGLLGNGVHSNEAHVAALRMVIDKATSVLARIEANPYTESEESEEP